jgi:hypothetical protein
MHTPLHSFGADTGHTMSVVDLSSEDWLEDLGRVIGTAEVGAGIKRAYVDVNCRTPVLLRLKVEDVKLEYLVGDPGDFNDIDGGGYDSVTSELRRSDVESGVVDVCFTLWVPNTVSG